MKKLLSLSLLSLLLFSLAACERDDEADSFDGIEVIAEPLSGGAKVAVTGEHGTWVAGERIRINNSVEAVEYHDGSAYIPYATPQEVNRALYPATLTATALSSDLVNVTFPAEYHYQTSGGRQVLELPMAARSEGRNPLHFSHLTGALCFLVINDEASTPLTLQSLTVVSSGYKLNGTRRINIAAPDTTSVIPATLAADRTVKMYFDHGLVVPAGDTVRVMIPVAPVGADNRFTVTLKYFQDGTNNSFKFSRVQTTGGALLRNQLGYAPTNIHTTTGGSIQSDPFFEKESGRYYIYTPLDFKLMNQACVNDWVGANATDYYYKYVFEIKNNLDMDGYIFTPIRNFSGVIKGNDKVVSNLTIQSTAGLGSNYYCAFFWGTSKDSIVDISFENLSLQHLGNSTGNLYISGLEAVKSAALFRKNCNISIGSINISGTVSGTVYYGGIVGEASNSVNVTNCQVSTPAIIHNFSYPIYWGGLVGSMGGYSASFTNSSWTGTGDVNLTSTRNIYAGGMIGYKRSNPFNVNNSSVSGTIRVSLPNDRYYYLGSLIGYFNTPGSPSITSTTRNVDFYLNGSHVDDIPDYNYVRP